MYSDIKYHKICFRYTATRTNLMNMAPGAALDRLGDVGFINNVVAGIIKSVLLGEEVFEKPFGGYAPQCTEFGATPVGALSLPLAMNVVKDGRALLLLVAYYDNDRGHKMRKIQLSVNGRPLPIWDAYHLSLLNADLIRFPNPIIIEPGSTFEHRQWDQDGDEVPLSKDAGFIGYVFASYGYLIGEGLRRKVMN
ncbi:MAG: hypothetical protein PHI12_12975 [Dehalococcoidales bacterium]|nr:hypothetical protein [Dehalococcoidales bacterium]